MGRDDDEFTGLDPTVCTVHFVHLIALLDNMDLEIRMVMDLSRDAFGILFYMDIFQIAVGDAGMAGIPLLIQDPHGVHLWIDYSTQK